MTIDLDVLAIEVTTDPLGLGYAGLSNEAVADLLNAKSGVLIDRGSMSGDEIFNAADPTEFANLTAAEKNLFMAFCGRSVLDPFAANNVSFVMDLFGGGSTTISNLISERRETVQRSRADNIGLSGPVLPGDIEFIRRS